MEQRLRVKPLSLATRLEFKRMDERKRYLQAIDLSLQASLTRWRQYRVERKRR